jgi:23S rRNA pseudouridine2605 synthase
MRKKIIQTIEPPEIRLNKFIANAGICSRREADKLILSGKISVNDQVVQVLGTKVMATDKITYFEKTIQSEKLQYILLNKPKDFITTTHDPQNRRTVMTLVKRACVERIYPVGRLDRYTTGLLLLTNDGDLAKRLTHPKYKIKKVYQLKIDKPISEVHYNEILAGVHLDDGLALIDQLAILTEDRKSLGIEIHIGKNRIVRRIFEKYGYKVLKLDRVMFGSLTKQNLSRGKWRFLNPREVENLKGKFSMRTK